MFQERLPTHSIRSVKSGKLRQTKFNEFLHDFVMKKARTNTFFKFLLFSVQSFLIR